MHRGAALSAESFSAVISVRRCPAKFRNVDVTRYRARLDQHLSAVGFKQVTKISLARIKLDETAAKRLQCGPFVCRVVAGAEGNLTLPIFAIPPYECH